MCDEFTESDNQTIGHSISRRDFGVLAAASVAVATPGLAHATGLALTESVVRYPSADGTVDGFFVHPAKGKYPGVILLPDIYGLRDSLMVMARRLAAEGYAVLAVNQYYRSLAPFPALAASEVGKIAEARAKLAPSLALLTPDAVGRDAAAHVAFLDKQRVVNKRRGIGVHGYCQGGNFAVRSSSAVPARIRAVGSFHGGGLATDAPDSPHLRLGEARASYLIAVAKNDDERAPTEKVRFGEAAKQAGRTAEIEVYGGNHGWCVLDNAAYNQPEADRAYARLLALYAKL